MRLKPTEKVADPSFTCPICSMTSYNPNDIREQFCGNCHVFLQVLPFQIEPNISVRKIL